MSNSDQIMPAKQMIAFYSGHSSKRVLFVEGKTDHLIMEELRERIGGTFDIKMCGGRIALLEVWEALKKYPAKQNQYLFLADQDHWIFEGIPDEYQNQPSLIFTAGYCIENDLYADGEEMLNQMLTPKELNWVQASIQTIIKWYAFNLDQPKEDQDLDFNFGNPEKFKIQTASFDADYLQSISYQEPDQDNITSKGLDSVYQLRLRGKYFFELYATIFRSRTVAKVPFEVKHLLFICFAIGYPLQNSNIYRIRVRLSNFFPLPTS